MKDDYTRAVTVLRVKDGDTFECRVDLGFKVHVEWACRLYGLNAPEHDEPGGPEARQRLTELLAVGQVTVRSMGLDKFAGRFLGQVWSGGLDVGAHMVSSGHAVRWLGRGPKPLVPWPPVASAPMAELFVDETGQPYGHCVRCAERDAAEREALKRPKS